MTAAQAAKFAAIATNITVNSNLNVADLYVILGTHLRATVCTFWDGDVSFRKRSTFYDLNI
jgi:hypothetical protein